MKKILALTAALIPCISSFADTGEKDKDFSVTLSHSLQVKTPIHSNAVGNPANVSAGVLYPFSENFSLKGEAELSTFIGSNSVNLQITPHLYPYSADRCALRPYIGVGINGGLSWINFETHHEDMDGFLTGYKYKDHEWTWDVVPMVGVEFHRTPTAFCFAQFEYYVDKEATQVTLGVGF